MVALGGCGLAAKFAKKFRQRASTWKLAFYELGFAAKRWAA